MFGSQNPFGTTTGFGTGGTFGSTQPTAFGQTGSAFGTSAFGATTTPSTGGGLFGGTTTQTGSLFGSTGSSFGQPSTSTTPGFGFGAPATGSSMFGTMNQQPAASTGIFGASSSSFGQPRPQFGSSFSTTTPATGTSLFGQPQSTGLFGQTAGSSLFGSTAFGTGSVTTGTTIKFKPPTGTDTMMKNGVSSTISTSHQCITCMKEYENKSLEELRLEDYAANRKGGGQAGMVGFGATTQSSSIFSTPATQQSTFNFGATQNKPLFGTSTTGSFAPTGGSLFGQATTQSQNVFGKPTGFGMTTPASTSAFGTSTAFGTTGTSVFGQPQQKSLFGQPAGTTLFGSTTATTQPSTGFGTGFGTTFGATTQPSAFGVRPTFGAATTSAPSGFGFGSTANTGTSLFGAKQPSQFSFGATTPAFGATNTTGFGTSTGSLFGATKTTPSFGTGSTPAFGSTGFGSTPAFGTAGTNTTGGLFGSTTAAKPTGFNFGGTTTTTPFTGFGQTGVGTGSTFGSTVPTMGSTDPNAAANQLQQQQTQQLLQYLSTNPYGDNPLFRNVLKETNKREELLKPTNPAAQQALLASHYKVSPVPAPKLRPKPVGAQAGKTSSLFEGLEDEEDIIEPFTPRQSVKTLIIKPKDTPDKLSASTLLASPPLATNRSSTPITQSSSSPSSRTPLAVPAKDSGLVDGASVYLASSEPSFTAPTVQVEKPVSNLQSLDDAVSSLEVRGRKLRFMSSSESLDDSSQADPAPDPAKPPHPAGIVLTRPGYFTVPSMDDLASMVGPDGHCIVENFCVAREGYGNVYFSGRMDVARLNLDEIVHFRRMEITVYPDDDEKPPVGEGLNRKAQITLDKVWPINKVTRESITDPEKLKALGYQEKLERTTAKIGGRFLEYRPETGSWVFEVKHFSKYGLDESDNEVDEAATQTATSAKLPQQAAATKPADGAVDKITQKPPSAPVSSATFMACRESDTAAGYRSDDDDMEDMEPSSAGTADRLGSDDALSPGAGAASYRPVTQQLAEALGLSADAVQSMKASFFGREDEDDDDHELAITHPRLQRALVSGGSYQSPIHFDRTRSLSSTPTQSRASRCRAAAAAYSQPNVSQAFSEFLPSHVLSGAAPLPGDTSQCPTGIVRTAHSDLLTSSFSSPGFVPAAEQMLRNRTLAEPMVIPIDVEPVPLAQSLSYECQHMLADAACVAGYRARCGWGPRWTLTHVGKALNGILDDEPMETPGHVGIFAGQHYPKPSPSFSISVERVAVDLHTLRPDDIQKKNVVAMLEIQLVHSCCSLEGGSPIFAPNPSVDCLHDQDALVARLATEMGPGHADAAMMRQFHTILGLCVALWGRAPGCDPESDDVTRYSYAKRRKEALSDWLVDTTKSIIEAEITDHQRKEDSELLVMLSYLSGRDMSKACAVAQRSRDYRLCLLLAQNGSNPVSRHMLQKQLDHWKKFKQDRYINPERLRVYALLAGLMVWPTSDPDETINCCADLDWKRALALHLWYYCAPTCNISDAVAAYEAAFESDQPLRPYARPPYPPCYKDDVGEEPYVLDPEAPLDTCFLLLKLYCDQSQRLDRLLAPVSSVPSQLDFRISWLLHKLLQSFGFGHLSATAAETLHTSFAAQLESWGLWPWAVFALLHLEDATGRRKAVTELLVRHASGSLRGSDPETGLTEDETFVCDKLTVPPAWVYHAKAIRASTEGNFKDKAIFLLKGGIWNEAHETIVRHLATEAVIDDKLGELAELLQPLIEHSDQIQNWSTGGKVFHDFLCVCNTMKKATEGDLGTYDLEAIRPAVLSLCGSISSLVCRTTRDRLCQAEIAKKTAMVLQLITSADSGAPDSAMHAACHNIELLSMPEDYSIEDFELLARTCTENAILCDLAS
ncbi:nuclear pore complex protein Nup98-96 isoform X2 [Rhipicephalus microplus]|uniref:nuclear pore complex protein Nup98-96 isoform X2 n=1 Tax=Rhipicephalus microplus TaxID=6941 RepID=UPI003F6C912C